MGVFHAVVALNRQTNKVDVKAKLLIDKADIASIPGVTQALPAAARRNADVTAFRSLLA
jgi:hypothetical protein